MDTPLQEALRWQSTWSKGMDAFGRMCADALSNDDLVYAKQFAIKYAKCRARFWKAFARRVVAERHEVISGDIDWFGDRDQAANGD